MEICSQKSFWLSASVLRLITLLCFYHDTRVYSYLAKYMPRFITCTSKASRTQNFMLCRMWHWFHWARTTRALYFVWVCVCPFPMESLSQDSISPAWVNASQVKVDTLRTVPLTQLVVIIFDSLLYDLWWPVFCTNRNLVVIYTCRD